MPARFTRLVRGFHLLPRHKTWLNATGRRHAERRSQKSPVGDRATKCKPRPKSWRQFSVKSTGLNGRRWTPKKGQRAANKPVNHVVAGQPQRGTVATQRQRAQVISVKNLLGALGVNQASESDDDMPLSEKYRVVGRGRGRMNGQVTSAATEPSTSSSPATWRRNLAGVGGATQMGVRQN